MKVLVVDDSSVMRRIIKHVLEDVGIHDITEVEDGEECLNILKLESFDLILLDVHLPFIEDLEILKKIKEDKLSYAKIVVCTVESSKDYIMKAIRYGADDYIVKPFNKKIFKQKILKYKE